ncbi:MAG TPA: hypothetical protein VGM87_18380 [Roseomonas sp.]
MEPDLSPAETRDLERIAGIMIPADAGYRVPGADDPAIIADIVATLGRDAADVRAALAALAERAGGSFAALDDAHAEALAMRVLADGGRAEQALGRVVLAAYYRDDRVVVSLGREARAPFPKGHVLPDGDWSLLDAVKGRPPLWRDDRSR